MTGKCAAVQRGSCSACGGSIKQKYIVDPFVILDITGELPVILMRIELASGNIMKTYIYGNSDVLAHREPGAACGRNQIRITKTQNRP